MIHGHCECGNVEFEISGKNVDYSHCHCSQCRRIESIDRVLCKTGGSKAQGYDISDDLPCFDGYRPESS